MIVWLVTGETGEHADHEEWPVCIHRTLEGAHVKKKMFETWAELHSVQWRGDSEYILGATAAKNKEAWLKLWPMYRIHIDYTGIRWDVLEVEYDPDEQIPGNGA